MIKYDGKTGCPACGKVGKLMPEEGPSVRACEAPGCRVCLYCARMGNEAIPPLAAKGLKQYPGMKPVIKASR